MYEPLRADGGRGASSTEVKSTAADESSNECQHCDGECKAATASRTRKRARSASADVEDNEDNHPLKKRCLLLSAQTVVAATGSCDASATTPACPQPTSSGSSSSACQEARATLCVNKRSVADFTSVVQHVGSHICLWLTGTELSRFSRLSKDCQDRVARLCADYQVSVREVWAPLHPILTPLCARTLVLAMEKLMRCSPGESSLVRRCEWLRDDAEIKLPVRSLFISAHAVGETPHLSARISKEAFGCVLRNVRRIVPRLLIARLLADKSGWIEEVSGMGQRSAHTHCRSLM
jgi:hypothetical protein